MVVAGQASISRHPSHPRIGMGATGREMTDVPLACAGSRPRRSLAATARPQAAMTRRLVST
jgi:hypothetical protein